MCAITGPYYAFADFIKENLKQNIIIRINSIKVNKKSEFNLTVYTL